MKALRSANVQMTSDRVIKLGVIDLSFHRATAAVVTKIFEILGFTVERNFALHEETFRQLRAGDIDMVVSAWLPHSHGNYKKEVEQRVATVELGTHYEPFAYWGVPYYIPQQCVNSVEDLRNPDVKEGHKTMGPRENSNG